MKMKTDRGKRKVGRRLGLPETKRKDTNRRVSLHPPVEQSAPPPESEAPEEQPVEVHEAAAEEARRAPDDEQT